MSVLFTGRSLVQSILVSTPTSGATGLTWSYRGNFKTSFPTPTPSSIWAGGYGNGLYVVTGSTSPEGTCIMTSTDGINWTNQGYYTAQIGNVQTSIVHWNGSQFIIGSPTTNKSMRSPDGVNWSVITSIQSVYTIAWNGTHYVAGGVNGLSSRSTDGITWTTPTVITSWGNNVVTSIEWNGSYFMAVGNAGRCATSADGLTWTNRNANLQAAFGANNASVLAWNGSVWLTAGANASKVATSPDGITWTDRTAAVAATAYSTSFTFSAIWDGTKFLIGGQLGRIATSPDGVSWTYIGALNTACQAVEGSTYVSIVDIVYNSSVPQYLAIPSTSTRQIGTSV